MLKIDMNDEYEEFELAIKVMNGRDPTPKQADRLKLWLTMGKPSIEEWIEAVSGKGSFQARSIKRGYRKYSKK